MSKIVIALGGNALGNNPEEQKELVKTPAEKVASLTKEGHTVVVGHGNGPQVGMIFNAFADAHKINPKTPLIPFAECGGMSQGYIGYHMLTAIRNSFNEHGLNGKSVIYTLTDTIVDKNDPAFKNPTKPVGPFYETKEAAEAANPNSTIVEDAGRGFRKVVPSPKPIGFVNTAAVKALVNAGVTVITCGGGGIPVIQENGEFVGVDGVIDKDFACSKMADLIDADTFIVLTAVDRVYVNWGKPDQKALIEVGCEELEKYIGENQFAPGSMLPKVQACMSFVKAKPGRTAIIADLTKVEEALRGETGTKIVL